MNAQRITPGQRKALTGAALIGILLLALALRLYGIEWDARQLLHPDERQMLMVVDRLAGPASGEWHLLLTPASPLNPGFFAYGSLPLYLLKLVSAVLAPLGGDWADPDRLCLIGRGLAALFDVGTVLLVFLLGRRLYGTATGLLAALFVALAVMHVQAAHFYTVNPILTFLTVLTVLLALPIVERGLWRWGVPAGATWGLALATKVNAALLIAPLAVAWGLGTQETHGTRRVVRVIAGLSLALGVALVVFVVAEPYALIDAPTFVQYTQAEMAIARGWTLVPYTVQYIGTTPWLYPAWQTVWWGLGLPLAMVAWGGLAFLAVRAWRRDERADCLLVSWVLVYFTAVGAFLAKPVRYMLPIAPFLCLAGAAMLVAWLRRPNSRFPIPKYLTIGAVAVLSLLYAIAFVAGVYGRPHPWLAASEWIYRHVPARAVIVVETWEHGLPVEMTLDGKRRLSNEYTIREIDLHGPQDDAARAQLAKTLAACDVVVLASRRGYLPLSRLAVEYPLAARFYYRLFRGDLGFQLATSAATGPALGDLALVSDPIAAAGLQPPAGLVRPSGLTLPLPDESFVIYDHPMPLVFQLTRELSAAEMDRILGMDRPSN